MEWVLFYTDPWLCQKGSFDTSLGKPKPRLSLEEATETTTVEVIWLKINHFEGVILEICTSKIIDHFGGACFLPSFSGTSLSYHGGSRFGDTFWGAFSCPSEISANHMGRFLATLSSCRTLCQSSNKMLSSSFCVKDWVLTTLFMLYTIKKGPFPLWKYAKLRVLRPS